MTAVTGLSTPSAYWWRCHITQAGQFRMRSRNCRYGYGYLSIGPDASERHWLELTSVPRFPPSSGSHTIIGQIRLKLVFVVEACIAPRSSGGQRVSNSQSKHSSAKAQMLILKKLPFLPAFITSKKTSQHPTSGPGAMNPPRSVGRFQGRPKTSPSLSTSSRPNISV